ncbi:hypothetical protein Poli38472_006644 [Pythium oligandrum]|uniref:glucan endo-1,3-beta-D-glucosidase n=1 Tax=Pythium oligandrum TaxID=41045 RepID=A0A8K1C4Y6_PYTOL|nr:hypothetical protein Poli38472_006644 [Pythium oligandrum]|eukprot:TMW56634.1 hypothetical protein Poli38472_006644 [Pythium oligandrum]
MALHAESWLRRIVLGLLLFLPTTPLSKPPLNPHIMVNAHVWTALTALLAASTTTTSALDKELYGVNYDLRQGPDWDPAKCKNAKTIASELKVLSTITKNVRTYSLADCDVTPVIKSAKELGLTVWLGVWISGESKVFEAEVETMKELIKAGLIDDNIVGFNVGSEAVYRKDVTAEQAIADLTEFKKLLKDNDLAQPVSITDIVDVMLQYPEMIEAGDVVTVNQFPFWEKMDVKAAAAQFRKRIQPLLSLAGKKEVIISETGWASAGKNENASDATPESSARYLNDFYLVAEEEKWKYYYFQAFDSPWKAQIPGEEDTVEGGFGIFDKDGVMKPEFGDLKISPREDTITDVGSASSDGAAGTAGTNGQTASSGNGAVHASSGSGASGTNSNSNKSSNKSPSPSSAVSVATAMSAVLVALSAALVQL